MICASEHELGIIKNILEKHASDCKVLAFGSRQTWVSKDYSDLDLAFLPFNGKKLGLRRTGKLEEAFTESELPYRVDVVDYFAASGDFRKIIDERHDVLFTGQHRLESEGRLGLKLGELCENVSVTFRRKTDKVILINTSDVLDGKVTNHAYVPNENLRGQFKKTFQKGDILYSEIRPKNRRFAFVDFDSDDYIASTKLMVIRANEKVLPEFLFQVLKSDSIIDQLQMLAETRSGTFPQITFSELAALDFQIPSIDEQRGIAATLRVLEDKIANNTKINRHLEQMAQAIFKSWFVDFDPFGGTMPSGWNEMELGDIAILSAGGDKPTVVSAIATEECDVPIYSNGLDNFGLYGYTNNPKITQESVTISARGTIGYVCLRQDPFVPIVRLITAIPNTSIITAKFLYLFLNNVHIAGVGTTQQQLTVPDFKKYRILVPDFDEVVYFTQIIDPMFDAIRHNRLESENIASLRDNLLPRLMSGEISVTNLTKNNNFQRGEK